MRVKIVGETFDNLELERVNLDLEKVVIEKVGALEILLNKGQETKEYFVNVCYQVDMEQKYGGMMIYQSENFKSKKKAKKEYNKILKTLEDGDYILKLNDLNGYIRLEFKEYPLKDFNNKIYLLLERLEKALKIMRM